MKKAMALVLILILVFALAGCSVSAEEKMLLLKNDGVEKISVTSLPEYYNYSFSGQDTQAIVDYLSELNLISDFSENPNEYYGKVWVISIEYESGEAVTVYHFGNMFIRAEDEPWYKMTYEEASRFGDLLEQLNS